MMHVNGMLSLGALLVNIAMPLFAYLLVWGVVVKLFFAWCSPTLSILTGQVLECLLRALRLIAECGAVRGLYLTGKPIGIGTVLFYYALLLVGLARPVHWRLRLLVFGCILCVFCAFVFRVPAPALMVVSSGDGTPPAILLMPSREPPIVLQTGSRSATLALLEEMKRQGAADDLRILLPAHRDRLGTRMLFRRMRPRQLHLFPAVRRTAQGRSLEQAALAIGCSVTIGENGRLGALHVQKRPQGW